VLFILKGYFMETRVAVLAIIVENTESVEELNKTLHEYGSFIIGRMGLPYREKGIHIVSVAIDAPQDKISALAGKVGKIDGISVKTAYSNVVGV
jgi:putative iron-only hydrogenase system regulator